MKDKIIDYHPIIGYITYKDLIDDINSISEDYKILEERICDILKNYTFDDETISALFKDNIKNRLDNISYVLKSLL